MNTKFISVSLGFIIVGLILVSFFWRQEMLLTILLVLMLIVKHKILPIKKEFTLFVIAGVSGTMVESLIMLAGPWSLASVLINRNDTSAAVFQKSLPMGFVVRTMSM